MSAVTHVMSSRAAEKLARWTAVALSAWGLRWILVVTLHADHDAIYWILTLLSGIWLGAGQHRVLRSDLSRACPWIAMTCAGWVLAALVNAYTVSMWLALLLRPAVGDGDLMGGRHGWWLATVSTTGVLQGALIGAAQAIQLPAVGRRRAWIWALAWALSMGLGNVIGQWTNGVLLAPMVGDGPGSLCVGLMVGLGTFAGGRLLAPPLFNQP